MKKVSTIVKDRIDDKLKDGLKNSLGVLFVGYSGVASSNMSELRKSLKSSGAELFVTKNRFSSLALKNSLASQIADSAGKFIDGPVGLVFIKDDPVSVCKMLTEFSKTCTALELKGGYLEEQIIDKQDFKKIASIPSRQVLYQQIATGLNAPIAKLAMSLNQIIASVVYALKGIIDKKNK